MSMHMLRRVFPRLALFRVYPPLLPTVARLGTRPVSPRPSPVRAFHPATPRLTTPPPSETPPADASVSQRLKHLVKSYGWYALGVYLVFSALDFTVAFVGIHLLGAEQVAQAAAYVRQAVSAFLRSNSSEPGGDETEAPAGADGGHEGLYATIVLAYTIHKTVFLPLRVGLTAALTPRIVGWLRARGWAGGEGARRAARERIRITNGDHD